MHKNVHNCILFFPLDCIFPIKKKWIFYIAKKVVIDKFIQIACFPKSKQLPRQIMPDPFKGIHVAKIIENINHDQIKNAQTQKHAF